MPWDLIQRPFAFVLILNFQTSGVSPIPKLLLCYYSYNSVILFAEKFSVKRKPLPLFSTSMLPTFRLFFILLHLGLQHLSSTIQDV